jgi:serine/threonine protein kinase/tetratricopeptide (TPR) repeat protein
MTEHARTEDFARTWRIRSPEPEPVEMPGPGFDNFDGPTARRRPKDTPATEPDRGPSPADPDADSASLLVEEFFLRPAPGDPPRHSEGRRRLSDDAPMLGGLVRPQDLIRTLNARKRTQDRLQRLIAEGQELFGFRLRHQLGRGAFASVYLAEQPDLACRPVVLKISDAEGIEHQTLARLQHTNIVPIFSVHEDAEAGLRAVCMPYFGGATLSAVLENLWEGRARPVRGAQFVEALAAVGSPMSPAPDRESAGRDDADRPATAETRPRPGGEAQTPLSLWRGLSYDKAAAWIVAQLAEGLQHAHERGILHRDIKPSNILLSAEGQPLLLDFNVAQEMASDSTAAILGGTVAYAAPEHLAALLHLTPELIRGVDRRSDLYSLGLVLAETIAGERLFEHGGSYSALTTQLETMAVERNKSAPSLREIRRDVPWGLESITRKCLDPDPTRRYQQGDHLAEDLRRFIDDRPLKYAPELSRVDRVRKFFRRHPRLLTAGPIFATTMAALLLVVLALVGARSRLAEAGTRLGRAQAAERKRAHDAGAVRAMCLVNTVLGHQDHLRKGVAVCEQTLALYGSPAGHGGEHPDWIRLEPEERRQLAEDHRELMLLLAGARVRLAPGDRPTLVRSLALLDEAEAIPDLPPSRALWLDRAGYWSQLGDVERATRARAKAGTVPAAGARDHYLLAISYARQGGVEGYRLAIAELGEALELQPRHYWSALQRGICRMELGEYAQALGDFGHCIGLWPEHPWGYFNRGCVLDRMGLKADAIGDYTAALDRDPELAAAISNRALARVELQQYGPALEDFDRAIALGGAGDAALVAGRALALEGLGRHAEADEAFGEAFAMSPESDPTRVRLRWTYGFAVSSRLPDRARAAFDEVLGRNPRHPQALYGRAMLAMNGGDLALGLKFFDRALEADPGFIEARRYRAVLLSRRGEWDRATRDINWCLAREPHSGATLYAAACVAARAAEAAPSPRALDRAFELLERAWSVGSGLKADDDPDLAALRRDPRFARRMATILGSDHQDKAAFRPPHESGRDAGD